VAVIRLLIANGCSYTRGAELDRPEREAWPALLAARLGVPVVNLASDGGSNRRIVRTTLVNLERLCREHGVSVAETLTVCMWTGLARGEYHARRRRDRGNRPDLPYETNWHRLGRWRIAEDHKPSAAYFGHLWNEEGAVVDLLVDWLLLDSHLRSLGGISRYCFAWDVLPARLPLQARPLIDRLDATAVYGGSIVSARSSFYDTVAGTFATGSLYHPLVAGHDHFAARLEGWLCGQGLVAAGRPW